MRGHGKDSRPLVQRWSHRMGETKKAVPEFRSETPVVGKAGVIRADAGKGCGFCEGVTIRQRANAVCRLTHGVPPVCEFSLSMETSMGGVGGTRIERELAASGRATGHAAPR